MNDLLKNLRFLRKKARRKRLQQPWSPALQPVELRPTVSYADSIPREPLDERDLCGCAERSLLCGKTTPRGPLDLVCCDRCGLGYLAECAEHDHLEDHGKHGGVEGSKGGQEPTDVDCDRIFAEYEDYARKTLDYLQQKLGDLACVLVIDLAAGAGSFVKVFREAGAQAPVSNTPTFSEQLRAKRREWIWTATRKASTGNSISSTECAT